jgi:hypothetical protein
LPLLLEVVQDGAADTPPQPLGELVLANHSLPASRPAIFLITSERH